MNGAAWRGLPLLAALLLAVPAALRGAAPPSPPATAAATGDVRMVVGQTATLRQTGASTAFAVDPDVVEASAVGGDLLLVARRVGQTLVTLVRDAGVETLLVRVDPPAPRAIAASRSVQVGAAGTFEARYQSANRRLNSSLAVGAGEGARTARLRVAAVNEQRDAKGQPQWALPAVSVELTAPGRRMVLFDELVEGSPLTLDGAVVRGLHLQRGGLALHAGVASSTPWNDFLLPSDGDRALGLSYRLQRGGGWLVPRLLWLPDADAVRPGVISLGWESGTETTPLQVRAELGWSGVPGASLDLAFHTERQHGWLRGARRPAELAALGLARPPGSFVDGAWSASLSRRLTADLALSASDLEVVGHRQQARSARFDLRHQTSARWSLQAGLGGGGYRDRDRPASAFDRQTLSLGTAYAGERLGLAALYRYQEVSNASRGGHGGRLTVRAGRGSWRGNLFADVQQEAPTVALMLRSRPGLERAFAELGLSAGTPEEAVRMLRDNSVLLADRGVEVGAVELDPLRVQVGGDVAWRGGGRLRPELGLRVVADEARDVGDRRRGYLATAAVSVRPFGDTELQLAYTRWSQARGEGDADERDSVEVALRTHIDEAQLAALGSRAIRGTVSRDDEGRGELSTRLLPLGGVEVVLDGERRTRTDSDGGFVFDPVGKGTHRVQVVLPQIPGAYFTTPSSVEMVAGEWRSFAITLAGVRLAGSVRSDAGSPLAGVTVRVEGATHSSVVTDSAGAFVFSAAAGDVRLSIVPDSLPAGYDLAGLRPVTVRLVAGAPASRDFTVPAQRSVSGVVRAAKGAAVTVTALELRRSVTPGPDGRFVLRGLPAGPVTLVAKAGSLQTSQVVELAAAPAVVDGVELALR